MCWEPVFNHDESIRNNAGSLTPLFRQETATLLVFLLVNSLTKSFVHLHIKYGWAKINNCDTNHKFPYCYLSSFCLCFCWIHFEAKTPGLTYLTNDFFLNFVYSFKKMSIWLGKTFILASTNNADTFENLISFKFAEHLLLWVSIDSATASAILQAETSGEGSLWVCPRGKSHFCMFWKKRGKKEKEKEEEGGGRNRSKNK